MQPVLAEYPFSPVHCYLRHFSCIILSADKMTYQTMHWCGMVRARNGCTP